MAALPGQLLARFQGRCHTPKTLRTKEHGRAAGPALGTVPRQVSHPRTLRTQEHGRAARPALGAVPGQVRGAAPAPAHDVRQAIPAAHERDGHQAHLPHDITLSRRTCTVAPEPAHGVRQAALPHTKACANRPFPKMNAT